MGLAAAGSDAAHLLGRLVKQIRDVGHGVSLGTTIDPWWSAPVGVAFNLPVPSLKCPEMPPDGLPPDGFLPCGIQQLTMLRRTSGRGK